MSGQDDDQERNEEPTQKRLDDARKKGDVAKSTELSAAVSYFALLVSFFLGSGVIFDAAQFGRGIIAYNDGASFVSSAEVLQTVLMLFGLLLLPAAVVIVILIVQRAFVFAPDKLKLKASRISPISNAKQKFGADGLIAFAKNTVKLLVVGIVLTFFLVQKRDEIIATVALEPKLGLQVLIFLLGQFLFLIAVLSAVIGGIDLVFQKQSLLRRNRMSRKDMTDEMKESDGDPHAKSTRRQRGQDIAMNQMLNDVDGAAVVIVNPTHYAVALKWQRGEGSAPTLVAKGVDEIAMRIRERAKEAGVPIHSAPSTARALHASVEIGQQIDRKHYESVAAAIRFADMMRRQMRGKGAR